MAIDLVRRRTFKYFQKTDRDGDGSSVKELSILPPLPFEIIPDKLSMKRLLTVLMSFDVFLWGLGINRVLEQRRGC